MSEKKVTLPSTTLPVILTWKKQTIEGINLDLKSFNPEEFQLQIQEKTGVLVAHQKVHLSLSLSLYIYMSVCVLASLSLALLNISVNPSMNTSILAQA